MKYVTLVLVLLVVAGCTVEEELPLEAEQDPPEVAEPEPVEEPLPAEESEPEEELQDTKYCERDSDCVAAQCCHPGDVINKAFAPDCSDISCTAVCSGKLDCVPWQPVCEDNVCGYVIEDGGEERIPDSVLTTYAEFAQQYGDSLGAALSSCINDEEEIYMVHGGGGFTAETIYYDAAGKEIAAEQHTDAIIVGDGSGADVPIDIDKYECTVLMETG